MTMEFQDIKSTIEGILFASGEPVPLARLCQVLEQDKNTVEGILHALADEYAFQRRGMRILQLGDRYQMCSAPEYADLIRQALDLRKPPQLSLAALESLAIIAYFQPATKGVVEQIRGVDSSYTVNLLVERGLIQEAGRLNAPGRPVLWVKDLGRPAAPAGTGRGTCLGSGAGGRLKTARAGGGVMCAY